MNDVQTLDFQGHPVRMLELEGQHWWVLRDICEVLGLTTPARVAERLDDDEVSLAHITDSLGRKQETTIVSESGLYAVILRSDKPMARPFRKWVTSEVLPSIRATGRYELLPPQQFEGELLLRTGKVLYSQRCKICTSEYAPMIDAMLGDADTTYDQIIAWAAERGLSISKGGLSRHNQKHRIAPAAPKALAENPEVAARIMLAKLTSLAQQRSLDGLSDRDLVKYQTNLAVSLSKGLIASGPIRALPTLVDSD